jgi:hypothetical protein
MAMEWKIIDHNLTVNLVQGETVEVLNNISKGYEHHQRIGRSIKLKSIELLCKSTNTARIMLVWQREDNERHILFDHFLIGQGYTQQYVDLKGLVTDYHKQEEEDGVEQQKQQQNELPEQKLMLIALKDMDDPPIQTTLHFQCRIRFKDTGSQLGYQKMPYTHPMAGQTERDRFPLVKPHPNQNQWNQHSSIKQGPRGPTQNTWIENQAQWTDQVLQKHYEKRMREADQVLQKHYPGGTLQVQWGQEYELLTKLAFEKKQREAQKQQQKLLLLDMKDTAYRGWDSWKKYLPKVGFWQESPDHLETCTHISIEDMAHNLGQNCPITWEPLVPGETITLTCCFNAVSVEGWKELLETKQHHHHHNGQIHQHTLCPLCRQEATTAYLRIYHKRYGTDPYPKSITTLGFNPSWTMDHWRKILETRINTKKWPIGDILDPKNRAAYQLIGPYTTLHKIGFHSGGKMIITFQNGN